MANRKLKALRVGQNLTQVEMAKNLGMGKNSYIFKENGQRDFKVSEAKRIMEFFNLKFEDIFFD